MQEIIYRKEYPVNFYEVGIDEKLIPFSLFNYFQDIAAEHAVNLGFGREDLIKMNKFWILSRMAMEVKEKFFIIQLTGLPTILNYSG